MPQALYCVAVPDDISTARVTAQFPPPDITPEEFEEYVAQLLSSTEPVVDNLTVMIHDKIEGSDGAYDFDATVRYQLAGVSFLVLVEAKRHKNPIKRELVQVLHQKVQSVGGHKGVMISTAPYQTGAVKFARAHGIALVTVTEGRFTYETRDMSPGSAMSREEAAERFNLPTFVSHYYGPGSEPDSVRTWRLSPEDRGYPQYVAEFLLGCQVPPGGLRRVERLRSDAYGRFGVEVGGTALRRPPSCLYGRRAGGRRPGRSTAVL
jgi:hypothetical protein